MNDAIAQYFRTMQPIPEGELQVFLGHLRPRHFKKGEEIVSVGQVQRDLFFIENGVQMSYIETEQKLHVIAFTYPPGLCAIPESFCFQKPSPYTLKALTDTATQAISFQALETVFAQSHAIERLFRKMTEGVLAGVISRHVESHTLSMEERYKAFCKRSSHLLQLVAHKYIASYLGMDSTNFSKLYNSVRI